MVKSKGWDWKIVKDDMNCHGKFQVLKHIIYLIDGKI